MRTIKYSKFAAELEKRRAKLPPNLLDAKLQSTSKRRTASKKALLGKIEEGTGRTGIDWRK